MMINQYHFDINNFISKNIFEKFFAMRLLKTISIYNVSDD